MILPSNSMAWSYCRLYQNIFGSYYNTNTRFGFQNYKSVSGYISDNNLLPYSNSFGAIGVDEIVICHLVRKNDNTLKSTPH